MLKPGSTSAGTAALAQERVHRPGVDILDLPMLVAGRSISSLSNPNWRYLLRIGDRRGISAAAISTGAVVSNRTAPAIHDTTIRLARCERPLALARKPRRFNHAVGGAGACDAWPSWRVVGGTMVLKVQVGQWNRPHHRGDHSCGAHPYCSHHDSVVRTVSVEWASTVYLPAASRRAPRGTTASGRDANTRSSDRSR